MELKACKRGIPPRREQMGHGSLPLSYLSWQTKVSDKQMFWERLVERTKRYDGVKPPERLPLRQERLDPKSLAPNSMGDLELLLGKHVTPNLAAVLILHHLHH